MIPHKKIGSIGEAKALSKFMEYGIECYLPFNETTKSDFIIDIKGKLTRIQIKTSNTINHNSIVFNRCQSGNKEPYAKTDVDYFVFYNMIDDELYMLPYSVVYSGGTTSERISIRIRYDSHVQRRVLKGKDWLIDDILTDEFEIAKIAPKSCSVSIEKEENRPDLTHKSLNPGKEKLEEFLREGISAESIGNMYGVTGSCVRRWCINVGIEIRDFSRPQSHNVTTYERTCFLCGKKFITEDKNKKYCSKNCLDNRALTKVDIDKVKDMYYNLKMSFRKIASCFGVHHKIISRFIRLLEEKNSEFLELIEILKSKK